jgi:hypothetical protein
MNLVNGPRHYQSVDDCVLVSGNIAYHALYNASDFLVLSWTRTLARVINDHTASGLPPNIDPAADHHNGILKFLLQPAGSEISS